MNPQDIPLEELLMEQERRKMAKQNPQAPQQPNIQAILQQSQPQDNIGNRLMAGLQNAARTGAEMTTGVKQPDAYSGGGDLYKTYMEKILGEQAKQLYQDPLDNQLKQARIQAMSDKVNNPNWVYGGIGPEGDPIFIPAPKGKVQMQPVGYTPSYQQRASSQGDLASQQAGFMRNMTQGGDGQYVVPDVTIGGVHAVNPNVERQLAQNKPENSADAGRTTLAQESIAGIDEVIKTLFPTGKAESFKRGVATGSNLPGIRLPMVGRITPSVRPDNPLSRGDDAEAQKAQNVFRRMGSALSGRQLIQTGVAARPEETQKLIEQFSPNLTSNPQAALDGLMQLRQFYVDYLNRVNRAQPIEQPMVAPQNNSGLDDETAYQEYLKAIGQ